MEYRPTWDLTSIPDKELVSEHNRRIAVKRASPPRAKVLRPCPKCGRPFGARDLRKHVPTCPGGSPAQR